MTVIATLHTSADGFWSDIERAVNIVDIEATFDTEDFGELRVYFDTTWDVTKDGLIYTDTQFLKEFRELLCQGGFTVDEALDVTYSEQGMQGDDYVSMDIFGTACAAWHRLYAVDLPDLTNKSENSTIAVL